MVYFFLLLFLASIVLLIFGLTSPTKALFWYKGNRERKRAFLIYFVAALLSLAGLALTAPEVDTKAITKKTSENENKELPAISKDTLTHHSDPKDYSKFTYLFPESNYSFGIEISGIETKIKKEAFVHQDDQYSPKEKVDGYILKIKFKITNPYNKLIMAPVPTYFYIGTIDNTFFSASTTRHRDCSCQIDNSTDLTDTQGESIYSLSDGKCGYSNPCVKFEPNEAKEFIITFNDPVYKDAKQLIFHGFNRRSQSTQSTKSRDIVLLIDTEQKKVINEIQL